MSIYSSNILFTFSKKKSCFVPAKKSSQKNIPRLTPTWLYSLFFSFRIYASFSSQGPDHLFRIIIIMYLFLLKNITRNLCIKSFLAQFAAIQVRIWIFFPICLFLSYISNDTHREQRWPGPKDSLRITDQPIN